MFLQSRWFRSAAVIAFLAMSAVGFDRQALAIQDSEDKVWFGPVGLARGDAARVNVVCDRQSRYRAVGIQASRLRLARGCRAGTAIPGRTRGHSFR